MSSVQIQYSCFFNSLIQKIFSVKIYTTIKTSTSMNCVCFERTTMETMIVVLNQFIVNLENYVTFAVFILWDSLSDNLSEVNFFHQLDWLFANIHNRLQSFPNSVKRWGESEILLGNIFLSSDGDLRRSEFDQSNLFEG